MVKIIDKAVQELHSQSVLEMVGVGQELLLADQHELECEMMSLEARKEWLDVRMHECQHLQEGFEAEMKQVDEDLRVVLGQKDSMRQKRLMLADLDAFARRQRFKKDGEGACFFRYSLVDFAEQCNDGVVSIRQQVPAGKKYGKIVIKGKEHMFLRGGGDELYFSEELRG